MVNAHEIAVENEKMHAAPTNDCVIITTGLQMLLFCLGLDLKIVQFTNDLRFINGFITYIIYLFSLKHVSPLT